AKDVRILPVELINAPQDDPDSLLSLLRKLMPGRDSRLGTPEGWNTLFWDKVKEFQVPAKSLIDYQTWTLSGDLEKQIVASFRQGMIDGGISPFALNAFDQSNISGWAAANPPTPGDAIALMDIQAVLSGSVEGTVHEWREFRIPRLGSDPVFGVQYGNGTVTMNLPGYGPMDAAVDIRFDQFDELGKAVGGTVTAIPLDVDGYRVVFTYKPDGSKEGQVFDPNGNIVGYLTMAVDHDRFTNYVSIKEGTEIKLPLPEPTPTKPSSTIIVQ
ncbi:MAG: hypothetical protein N2506_06720, partial [Dehalococcoidales bacterium]|nr:hypothetical protein [Dehalococcoidales bacterium]